MDNKECNNCKYNDCEAVGGRFTFYCGNENSEMAGSLTDYDDTCDEWEARE